MVCKEVVGVCKEVVGVGYMQSIVLNLERDRVSTLWTSLPPSPRYPRFSRHFVTIPYRLEMVDKVVIIITLCHMIRRCIHPIIHEINEGLPKCKIVIDI